MITIRRPGSTAPGIASQRAFLRATCPTEREMIRRHSANTPTRAKEAEPIARATGEQNRLFCTPVIGGQRRPPADIRCCASAVRGADGRSSHCHRSVAAAAPVHAVHQAGKAIAAALVPGDWAQHGHGLAQDRDADEATWRSDILTYRVVPARSCGVFGAVANAIGRGQLTGSVEMGALWAALPEVNTPPSGSGWLPALYPPVTGEPQVVVLAVEHAASQRVVLSHKRAGAGRGLAGADQRRGPVPAGLLS